MNVVHLFSDGKQNSIRTSLSLRNIPNKDLKTLELKMASRRVKGGEIEKYITKKSRAKGLYNVKVVYKDESGKSVIVRH